MGGLEWEEPRLWRVGSIMRDDDDDKLTRDEAKELYVTIDRYLPVERLVYGGVALVLTGVLIAILAMVVRR